ncbi:PD-(D/E)XK nuclease family transposase, partial [Floccifex sp.]|uniref:PD-(D/E)XK nuclease family transposase n=1 Tax=Floccifex sp. TaxID=2815810 RepID=UPI003F085D5B
DDLFMRILFRNNKKLLEKVLNIVLNQTDIQIKRYEIQKDLKQVLSKSIVCDVIIEDTKGNIYDIEMERNNAKPERLRYYASVLDIEYLKKNMRYDECREIHVIFITEEDIYKKGFPVYQVERTIKQLDNSPFNDRMHLMVVNGQYRGSDELGLLMYDFGCSDYRDMKTIELKEAVKQLKTGNVEENDMCEALERFGNKKKQKEKSKENWKKKYHWFRI